MVNNQAPALKLYAYLFPLMILIIVSVIFASFYYTLRYERKSLVYPMDTTSALWQPLSNNRYQQQFHLTHPFLEAIEIALSATPSAVRANRSGNLIVAITSENLIQPLVANFPLNTLNNLKLVRLELPQLTSLTPGSSLTLEIGLDTQAATSLGVWSQENPLLSRPPYNGAYSINHVVQAHQLVFRPIYQNIPLIYDTSPFYWPYELQAWWYRLIAHQASSAKPVLIFSAVLSLIISLLLLYQLFYYLASLSVVATSAFFIVTLLLILSLFFLF